jgi:tetratricopeptide (TPR) repeat protein
MDRRMSPDPTFDEIEALFHSALALPSSLRAAFIAEHTAGNENLRREVLSLVHAFERADSLSGSPRAGEEQPAEAPPESAVGRHIGPYHLERLLGQGGMGEVYAARRTDGALEGEVALKLVAARMDSASLRSLFLQERDVLSQLRHPNIARLLDGGIKDGRPYLVMELVAGADGNPERLDEHFAKRRVALRRRVEMVITICEAVSYAHRKLIAHGDLKPGNVLVDKDGDVKLLDFGAARLLSAAGAAPRTGAFTPAFSSPEQCQGEPVTVQSDVYSMGKLLDHVTAGSDHPELAAVVAKATQKEPADRYAGIDALADDLRSWLKGAPLMACAGQRGYLLLKWIGRYWPVVSLLSGVILALSLLTLWAQRAARRATAERARATDAARDEQALAHRLLFQLQPQLRDLGSSTEAQRELANISLDYLSQLEHTPALLDEGLRGDVVKAYTRWGNLLGNPYEDNLGQPAAAEQAIRNGVREAEAWVAARPADLDARFSLAMAQRSLAETEFGEGKGQQALRDMLIASGSFDWLVQQPKATVDQLMEAAATEGSVADVYALPGEGSLGKQPEAMEWYRKCIALLQRILRVDPGYTRARRGIAITETKIGNLLLDDKPAQAVVHYKVALDILATMPPEAQRARPAMRMANNAEGHLARALAKLGKYKEAVAAMTQVRDRSAAVVALDPLDDQARYDLSTAQTGLGDVLAAAGQKTAARQSYLDAMATIAFLMRKQPRNPVLLDHRKTLNEALAALGAS